MKQFSKVIAAIGLWLAFTAGTAAQTIGPVPPNSNSFTGILGIVHGGSNSTTAGGALDSFTGASTIAGQYFNRTATGTWETTSNLVTLGRCDYDAWPGVHSGDQTTMFQQFDAACSLVAYTLKSGATDDQMQRTCMVINTPREEIRISSPIIFAPLTCWDGQGYFRRVGTGTPSSNTAYDGTTTAQALGNLQQPAVIFPPLTHNLGHIDVYATSNGSDNGSGVYFGKNWVPLAETIVAGGTGYTANDVLNLPQPSNSPYVIPQVTVDTVNGSGVIQTAHLSRVGSYALPIVLQEYQWTAANGFTGTIANKGVGKVFDTGHTGWYISTGGTGTGAEFTLTYNPDFVADGTDYQRGSAIQANTLVGDVNVQQAGATLDGTYGAKFAVGIAGLNYFPRSIVTQGGYYGFWCDRASDIVGGIINTVGSAIGAKIIGCTSSRFELIVDTPSVTYLSMDANNQVKIFGQLFHNSSSNTVSTYSIIIGSDSGSSSTNMNTGVDLDLTLNSAGAAGGIPAMSVANITGSIIDMKVDNLTKAGVAVTYPNSSWAVFGSNVTNNVFKGSIASAAVETSLFSGTLAATNVLDVWDAARGGYADRISGILSVPAPLAVPVCNQMLNPDGGLNSAGQQTSFRAVFYCPQGAVGPSLILTGFYVTGTTETSLVDPIPINLSVVNNVPAPWSSATSYVTGNSVTYNPTQSATSTFANNPIWTAAGNNSNSAPIPTNANWGAGAVPTPIAVTCFGGRNCTLPTQMTPAGTLVTQPILVTDPINITVPIGGYIAVLGWTNQTGTQKIVADAPMQYTAGNYFKQATSQADITLTAANTVTVTATAVPQPSAIIGIPLVNTPTVAIITDSRGRGICGGGVASVATLVGGGSYTSADEGVICTMPDTNASSFEVAASARVIITKVTAGAVAGAQLYDTGCYAGTANSQTIPSGSQVFVCGHGTLFAMTPTLNSSGQDFGDQYYASGYLQRALAESGIAFTGVVHSGETVAGWNTRDYDRLAFLQATHVRNVIIEIGINDIGTTPSTTEASLVTMANALLGNGYTKAVYLATMPPQATSNNGYADTSGQTTNANNANRVTLNTWIRTTPAPFAGYLETADPVESSRDSGKFKVNGTACNAGNTAAINVVTCDGLHLTTYGDTLITTALGNLSTFFQ